MKTTDLIPLILYQLADGDKYGYEIVKQIEDSSAGGIIIKQPTLYSLLKKLEQGRFISSYWQDSEIGGKRHYYKLTDNGKAQLDTYPTFEQLIRDTINDALYTFPVSPTLNEEKANTLQNYDEIDATAIPLQNNVDGEVQLDSEPNFVDNDIIAENFNSSTFKFEDKTDIKPIHIDLSMPISSNFIELNQETNDEAVLNSDDPTFKQEVAFDEDEKFSPALDTNNIFQPSNNSSIQSARFNIFDAIEPACYDNEESIKDINTSSPIEEVKSIDNNEIYVSSKFTEKIEPINEPYIDRKLYSKLTPNESLIEEINNEDEQPIIDNIEQIKYLNYVDFSTDTNSINRKKAIKKHIIKMTVTCLTLLLVFISTLMLCRKYSYSKLYYALAIVVCLVIVLYPILLLTNIHKIRLKYCSVPFKYSIVRDFLIKLSIFLSLVIAIFAYNLSNINSINELFSMSNFSNFVAPIMLVSVIMLDWLYSVILYKKSA